MDGEHSHCWSCVKLDCTEFTICPIERCANGCGASMHRCKWKEHAENTCPEARVICTNAYYGCTNRVPRKNLAKHIEHCPASVLDCCFSYYRKGRRCFGHHEEVSFLGVLVDEKLLAVDQDLSSTAGKASALDIVTENNPYGTIPRRSYTRPYEARRRTCKVESHTSMFFCNEIVRRDEFAVHWKTLHLDIQLDCSQRIERCPLQPYGCVFGQTSLVPYPLGSQVCYDGTTDAHSLMLAETCVEPESLTALQSSSYIQSIQKKKELAMYGYQDDMERESFDVLGQLPPEVLLVVISFLDSFSLWNLSLVNHYFRVLCFELVKTKGIVYGQWEKDYNSDLPWAHWIYCPKVWSFSKVTSKVTRWLYADVPSMSAHLESCNIYKFIDKNSHHMFKVKKVLPVVEP